jgi:aryl-alcohol dehydrogenase-like predicted oxidoreductase
MLIMKLALGTAQFGLPYGVANQRGQVSLAEAAAILQHARAAGIDTLDTAMAYGASEEVLGQIGIQGWRVITKLHLTPGVCIDDPMWIEQAVHASLDRLGVTSVYGLLLHRPEQLLGDQGEALYENLQRLKSDGVIKKVGISVYSPNELDKLMSRYNIDLVQAPFSIMDRRLITSGWMDRLVSAGVEIHARSVFLQGLLLMEPEKRPGKFARWQPLWAQWQDWLHNNRITSLQACLGFALSHSAIGRVIVGVDSQDQLKEILSALYGAVPLPPAELCSEDIDLINPSRWSRL